VTRLETSFLGREDLICLVEDTASRWVAQGITTTTDVEVLTS
jgi:hypothetical protein